MKSIIFCDMTQCSRSCWRIFLLITLEYSKEKNGFKKYFKRLLLFGNLWVYNLLISLGAYLFSSVFNCDLKRIQRERGRADSKFASSWWLLTMHFIKNIPKRINADLLKYVKYYVGINSCTYPTVQKRALRHSDRHTWPLNGAGCCSVPYYMLC
jgi:hypothetical protein